MKCAWLAGALAIVVLPTVVYGAEGVQRYEIMPEEISVVEAAVKDRLLDPDSAKFKPPRAGYTDDGRLVACGAVNAKNSYGGYVGFTPYYGYLENDAGSPTFKVEGAGDASADAYYKAVIFCADGGLTYK